MPRPEPELDIDELLERPLADTPLSVRTVNTLEASGLLWVKELLVCCGHPTKACDGCRKFVKEQRLCDHKIKLMELTNFGSKTLTEVFNMLEELGLKRSAKHPSLKRKRRRRSRRAPGKR